VTEVLVRKARLEEADALTELSMRAKASWGYDEAFMAQCRAELTVTREKMEAWSVWVAECDGRVAGVIALARDGDGAEIEDFMVEPAFQGAGVGSALMRELMDECRTHGLATIRVDADPNAEAIYHKLGFVTVGRSPSGSIPGRTLPRMARTI
jgi:GNAT superfamily N-acetyltransferase